MSADAERRSRLLSLKLRALVRDHLGSSSEPEGQPLVYAPGAGFLADDAVWLLADGVAVRALGAALAFAAPHQRPVRLLVERDSGVLARRAALMSADVEIWHVDDRVLLPAIADPHLPRVVAREEHLAFSPVITAAGADVVVEHGVVTGEVRGLEMCRVVDDATSGEPRLEVGMGAHDREAFALVHGERPTEEAMRDVIDAVRGHREVGAPMHPLNQFGAERLMRWQAIADPASVGFSSLTPCEPPVARENVKDAVPCAARGTTSDGEDAVAVFAHGVDLDVVPFAVDVADREGVARAVIVLRGRDAVAPIVHMAGLAVARVDIARV